MSGLGDNLSGHSPENMKGTMEASIRAHQSVLPFFCNLEPPGRRRVIMPGAFLLGNTVDIIQLGQIDVLVYGLIVFQQFAMRHALSLPPRTDFGCKLASSGLASLWFLLQVHVQTVFLIAGNNSIVHCCRERFNSR